MLKKFFKDSFLYTLATLFTKGLGFLMLPIYTHNLSQAEYGVFDYLVSIGAILSIIATVEITQGVMRYVSGNDLELKELSSYISTSIWFTLLLYSFVVLVCFTFSQEIALFLLNDSEKESLIKIASLYFCANSIVYLFNVIFRAQLKAKLAVIYSLISAVLVACFSLYALLVLKLGIEGVFYAQFFACLIIILLSMLKQFEYLAFTFDGLVLKKLISFSLPFVPSSLSVLVSVNADRLMIKEILDIESVAIYGVGARISSIVLMLLIGFQSALTPLIYTKYNEESTSKDIAKLFYIYLTLTIMSILFLSLFSESIVLLTAGKEYIASTTIIPLLALAAFTGSMYLFFPGLSIYKKTVIIAKINIFAALLNIPLNYILIKEFGIIGASLATFLSACIGWFLIMKESQKYYIIPIKKRYIILYIFLVFSIVLLSLLN